MMAGKGRKKRLLLAHSRRGDQFRPVLIFFIQPEKKKKGKRGGRGKGGESWVSRHVEGVFKKKRPRQHAAYFNSSPMMSASWGGRGGGESNTTRREEQRGILGEGGRLERRLRSVLVAVLVSRKEEGKGALSRPIN